MKITLNKSFCERIWKTHIARIREPTRTKKLRDRKNFDEDLEMDRNLLNRRLVYEPTIPKKKRKDF